MIISKDRCGYCGHISQCWFIEGVASYACKEVYVDNIILDISIKLKDIEKIKDSDIDQKTKERMIANLERQIARLRDKLRKD